MFLSTRLWWRGQWPGYQHPLRAGWRKVHPTEDPRHYMTVDILAGLFVFGIIELWVIGTAISCRGERDNLLTAGFYSLVAITFGLFTFVLAIGSREGTAWTFTRAIERTNQVLGIYITKDFPVDELRRSADIRLCELAGKVIHTEATITKNPHKDEFHQARLKAREEFASAHKLFLSLGLVEPTWDPYFQRQR